MPRESSPQLPPVEALRALARAQGVEPSDEDLAVARQFLEAILPELRAIEGSTAGSVAAGEPWAEDEQP